MTQDANLSVRISEALFQKLKTEAEDEGIDLGSLVSELLAEGVALRAWEIIERKAAMRGALPGASGHREAQATGNGNFRGPPKHGMPQARPSAPPGKGNTAWMEDRAAFLEYVRNQEKRRR